MKPAQEQELIAKVEELEDRLAKVEALLASGGKDDKGNKAGGSAGGGKEK
jgi:hypothetical protein